MIEVRDGNSKLCHQVFRRKDFEQVEPRSDLASASEPLQCSALKLNAGTTFRAHKHITIQKITTMTQESWCVVQGKVTAHFYDEQGKHLQDVLLEPGDMSMTFYGGHNYTIEEDNTLVYEYKTGPYMGQEKDKVFLDEL
tara:strand:- start:5056 stop:5472 length:417 start_codon:yes stop_codon:yes gene_type:complete